MLYVDEFADRTRILTTSRGLAQKERVARAQKLGLSLLETEVCSKGRVSTLALPQVLDQLSLNALYVEGEPRSPNPCWTTDWRIICSAINLPGNSWGRLP